MKGLPGVEGCQQQQGQAAGRVKENWGKMLLEDANSGTMQGGPHLAPKPLLSIASQHGSQTPSPGQPRPSSQTPCATQPGPASGVEHSRSQG